MKEKLEPWHLWCFVLAAAVVCVLGVFAYVRANDVTQKRKFMVCCIAYNTLDECRETW